MLQRGLYLIDAFKPQERTSKADLKAEDAGHGGRPTGCVAKRTITATGNATFRRHTPDTRGMSLVSGWVGSSAAFNTESKRRLREALRFS